MDGWVEGVAVAVAAVFRKEDDKDDDEEDADVLANSCDDDHASPAADACGCVALAPAVGGAPLPRGVSLIWADDPPPRDPPRTVVAATQPRSMTQKSASKCLTNSSTAGENCGRAGVPKLSRTCSTQGRPPPPFSKDFIDPKM